MWRGMYRAYTGDVRGALGGGLRGGGRLLSHDQEAVNWGMPVLYSHGHDAGRGHRLGALFDAWSLA